MASLTLEKAKKHLKVKAKKNYTRNSLVSEEYDIEIKDTGFGVGYKNLGDNSNTYRCVMMNLKNFLTESDLDISKFTKVYGKPKIS